MSDNTTQQTFKLDPIDVFEKRDYVTIEGWMVTELGLKGIDLQIYAYIYKISAPDLRTGKSEKPFVGSVRTFCKIWGFSVGACQNTLTRLINRALILIERTPQTSNNPGGGTRYWANADPILAIIGKPPINDPNYDFALSAPPAKKPRKSRTKKMSALVQKMNTPVQKMNTPVQKMNTLVQKMNTPADQDFSLKSEHPCSKNEHPCSENEHKSNTINISKSSLQQDTTRLEQEQKEQKQINTKSASAVDDQNDYPPTAPWFGRSWAVSGSPEIAKAIIKIIKEFVIKSKIESGISGPEAPDKITGYICSKLVALCDSRYTIDPGRLETYLSGCTAQKLGALVNHYLPEDFEQYACYNPSDVASSQNPRAEYDSLTPAFAMDQK